MNTRDYLTSQLDTHKVQEQLVERNDIHREEQ